MHGRGTYTWEDGKSYIGTYVNDQKCGIGTLTFSDGRSYYG